MYLKLVLLITVGSAFSGCMATSKSNECFPFFVNMEVDLDLVLDFEL
jgi:hypothetical protein